MNEKAMIEIEGLTKDYRSDFWKKKVRALDHFSVRIEQGDIFAFLGLNGSGKTTTFKILTGIINADSGVVKMKGHDIDNIAVKHILGYLPEQPYFYDYLSAEEILTFFGRMFGMHGSILAKRIDELLELVSLGDNRRIPLRKFSKGMLQRVGIAQALINDPEILLLDEPMSGLDPLGRKQMRDIILYLRDCGKTVFLSTHIIADIETVCDKVVIIHRGRFIVQGKVEDFLERKTKELDIVASGVNRDLSERLSQVDGVIRNKADSYQITLSDDKKVGEVLNLIIESGGSIESLTRHRATLEEMFVSRVFEK